MVAAISELCELPLLFFIYLSFVFSRKHIYTKQDENSNMFSCLDFGHSDDLVQSVGVINGQEID